MNGHVQFSQARIRDSLVMKGIRPGGLGADGCGEILQRHLISLFLKMGNTAKIVGIRHLRIEIDDL